MNDFKRKPIATYTLDLQLSDEVFALEVISANAWPASVLQTVDGWQLRYHRGVTSRANAVWPLSVAEDSGLLERIALAEAFYRRWNVPSKFKIPCIPATKPLDTLLDERGYAIESNTLVQTASIDMVQSYLKSASWSDKLHLTETFDPNWFATYRQAEQISDHEASMRQQILQSIGPRTAYVSVQMAAQTIGVGVGVVERGWLGIFSLSVQPSFRRQGAAKAIMSRLIEWGHQQGATQAYLQVMAQNQAAQALYKGLGFDTLYSYHYRVKELD